MVRFCERRCSLPIFDDTERKEPCWGTSIIILACILFEVMPVAAFVRPTQSHSQTPQWSTAVTTCINKSCRLLSTTSVQATKSDDETTAHKSATNKGKFWSLDDLMVFAKSEGVALSMTTLGPGFRAVARSTTNSSQILGYGEGFVRPSGEILHLDKMEVFQTMVQRVQKENPDFKRKGGTTFGVGLFFGYQCLLHGLDQGCKSAEFLAIDDEDYQHRRLVRFYSFSGFQTIKYVGDDFQDIPARMVWGGCGTLMSAKIEDLLVKWTELFERAKSSKET